MRAKVLFLGSGGSLGVPIIGCDCSVCQSALLFNRRLRPALLLSVGEKKFLLDVGPDFREQALRYRIDRIDGVLLTHPHYDHIAGIDELRIYAFRDKRPVPCLLSAATLEELHLRYGYLMPSSEKEGGAVQKFRFQILEKNDGIAQFEGLSIGYFSYFQLGMKVSGFRLGNFAYLTDLFNYSQTIFDSLKGIDTIVVSGRRTLDYSGAHLSIEEAIAFGKKTSARSIYLTHLSHEIDHAKESALLPSGVKLAYDGLELTAELAL